MDFSSIKAKQAAVGIVVVVVFTLVILDFNNGRYSQTFLTAAAIAILLILAGWASD